MAGRRLVFSPLAERDRDELNDYIAAESGEARAAAVLRKIQRSIDNIASAPSIGRVRTELAGQPRSIAVSPWLIIYDATDSNIVILRIIDGRRDLPEVLGRGV